jgi:hypothetical protein
MATLAEIWTLVNDPILTQKVTAACLIAADTIRQESGATGNHTNRLKWAKKVMSDPAAQGRAVLPGVIAANNAFTLAQINSASDAAIQTAVNNVVDIFADGT